MCMWRTVVIGGDNELREGFLGVGGFHRALLMPATCGLVVSVSPRIHGLVEIF